MKYFKIIPVLLLLSVISFYSCNDKSSTPKQETSNASKVSNSPTPANTKTTTQTPINAEPAQNAAGIWHYKCSKGCAGGAGSAVSCETCGLPLAHNQAYHTTSNTTSNSNQSAIPYANTPPAATAEPSRNASGVWHYTCPQGCDGGSGTTGNCNSCGNALAHNAAYHQ